MAFHRYDSGTHTIIIAVDAFEVDGIRYNPIIRGWAGSMISFKDDIRLSNPDPRFTTQDYYPDELENLEYI